jgi:hypothetical protein
MSPCRQATHINEPNAHVKRLNVLNVFGVHNRLRGELPFPSAAADLRSPSAVAERVVFFGYKGPKVG